MPGLPIQSMQVRAKRLIRKVLFPQSWSELDDTGGWMLADPLQNIDQVSVRIDAVQTAGHDQTLSDTDVLRAELCPTEFHDLRPIGIARSARSR